MCSFPDQFLWRGECHALINLKKSFKNWSSAKGRDLCLNLEEGMTSFLGEKGVTIKTKVRIKLRKEKWILERQPSMLVLLISVSSSIKWCWCYLLHNNVVRVKWGHMVYYLEQSLVHWFSLGAQWIKTIIKTIKTIIMILLLSRTAKGLRFHTTCKLNKLACRSLVDLGKRHSTLEAEIKKFITYSISSSQSSSIFSCQFLEPQFPQNDSKKARWHSSMHYRRATWA